MTTLVTGGAGYIGSHAVRALLDAGERVVVLDNLSTGIRKNVPEEGRLHVGNIDSQDLVREIIQKYGIDSAMHFAGSISVEESTRVPLAYYRNNVMSTLRFLDVLLQENVEKVVFSSTAAVYGDVNVEAVTEDMPTVPKSPYGRSKLMVEQMLQDAATAHGLRYVALRYFNVVGADPLGRHGYKLEDNPKSLVRAALQRLRARKGSVVPLQIFGTDYPTHDGTCIRDYVHVSDLADAHVAALKYLRDGGNSTVLNCGYGRGYSVREVISMVEDVSGKTLMTQHAAPRAGDPTSVVSDPSKLKNLLDWQPEFDDLEVMVKHQLQFEKAHS